MDLLLILRLCHTMHHACLSMPLSGSVNLKLINKRIFSIPCVLTKVARVCAKIGWTAFEFLDKLYLVNLVKETVLKRVQ